MENLVYVLKLLRRFNGIYFIKKSLFLNNFRKTLGLFIIVLFTSLIITIVKERNNFYMLWCIGITSFLSICLIFNLIDKDHKNSINLPLTMKFLKHDYLIFRIQAIKETLQKENRYNEIFLNKALEECDQYLILEANGVSFILKHPFMTIPISIISVFFGSLLWEVRNSSPLAIVIFIFMFNMILIVLPVLKNRFAQVRTMKFILQILKNQLCK